MIPIADSVRSRSFPIVNVTLIVLNILVFMYEVYLSQQTIVGRVTELDRFIADWGNIPACTFDAFGFSVDAEARTCGDQPDPRLTPLSAMFLHGSWLHLLGNMWFLYLFGNNVEDSMGHARFAVFYVVSGLAAALLQVGLDTGAAVPMVGASGAISGVMGGYLLLYPTVRVFTFVPIGFFLMSVALPAWTMLLYWFVLQLLGGVTVVAGAKGGGVAFWAHVGGFLAGALLIKLFARSEDVAAHKEQRWRPSGIVRERWGS